MNLITPNATAVKTPEQRIYRLFSGLFLFACVAVSLIFLATHGLIQSVKANVFTIEQLEAYFFPGVYWTLAAGCITLLAVSALFIGLTVAIGLIRACMYVGPCRRYWVVLLVQLIPWLYFFVSTA